MRRLVLLAALVFASLGATCVRDIRTSVEEARRFCRENPSHPACVPPPATPTSSPTATPEGPTPGPSPTARPITPPPTDAPTEEPTSAPTPEPTATPTPAPTQTPYRFNLQELWRLNDAHQEPWPPTKAVRVRVGQQPDDYVLRCPGQPGFVGVETRGGEFCFAAWPCADGNDLWECQRRVWEGQRTQVEWDSAVGMPVDMNGEHTDRLCRGVVNGSVKNPDPAYSTRDGYEQPWRVLPQERWGACVPFDDPEPTPPPTTPTPAMGTPTPGVPDPPAPTLFRQKVQNVDNRPSTREKYGCHNPLSGPQFQVHHRCEAGSTPLYRPNEKTGHQEVSGGPCDKEHWPQWSTFCGFREWNAPPEFSVSGAASWHVSEDNPHHAIVEFIEGACFTVTTCARRPSLTDDGKLVPVDGDACTTAEHCY